MTKQEKIREGIAREICIFRDNPKEYNGAGTLDAGGTVRPKKFILPDWKTGNFIPPKTRLQMATYCTFFMEMFPRQKVDEVRAVKLDKKTGLFTEIIMDASEIPEAFEAFLSVKRAKEYLDRNY